MKSTSLVLLAVLCAPAIAAAGDSIHQVCVGFGEADKKIQKIAVKLDEGRAGADKRKLVLHTQWNGRSFEGSGIGPGGVTKLSLLATESDKPEVLFEGTAEYLEGGGLLLTGTWRKSKFVAVLECTDA